MKLHNNDDIVVPRLCILWQYCIVLVFVLVISCYKDDIIVITPDQGRAEVGCNDNDII